MTEQIHQPYPQTYKRIEAATKEAAFSMASDLYACSLLRTLARSKPASRFLELGTGTGLSTSWIMDGMDAQSTLLSVDNDPKLLDIATRFLGDDQRLNLVLSDGGEWIERNASASFDFIFADTWHGKYLMLDEVLRMLNNGGFYIIDDMLPQENWPEGHAEKAQNLVQVLEKRTDLFLTKLGWSSGIIIAVKSANP